MLNRKQAKNLVEGLIGESDYDPHDAFVILEEETIEKPWGWVFLYQSRRFLETRDPSHMLAGNAPILVNRETGVAVETGTAMPVEEYIREYELEIGFSPDAA